jgi:type II secretory pathway pseudopilin PulG
VLLLIAVAVIGLLSATAVSIGAAAERRSAEQQLLAIGAEFQAALQSYAGIAPNATTTSAQGPRTLEDLVKDPRVPGIRRHLRRIYEDPLTRQANWGTITNARGEIVAIYSRADGRPLKQSNFTPGFERLEDADTYQAWVFGTVVPLRKPGASKP